METSDWLPPVIAIGVTAVLVLIVRVVLKRRHRDAPETAFRLQAWTIVLVLAGLVAMLFTLPRGGNQELLLGVLGLVVTASIALSSQSIIANGMAGLMLRAVSDHRPGDFVEVGGHVGRVSEMTLLHTEIQTADRDLVTLPNSLMITQPVKVVQSSGTIVSTKVSLGYDISHHWLEPLFVAAAAEAGLDDGFIQILELGDHSVTYRVAGFLSEPSRLLRARSQLRMAVLDTLHAAEIEVVSPMHVAGRDIGDELVIPNHTGGRRRRGSRRPTAEDLVFDKAELAAGVERMRDRLREVEDAIEELRQALAETETEEDRTGLERKLAAEERRRDAVQSRLGHLEALREEE